MVNKKRKTVTPKGQVEKLPWKKWLKVPITVVGALATLFVVLQGLAWVDGRHDQTKEIVFLTSEVQQIDEKVKSTAQRLDYIDLIQAVTVRDEMCKLAKKERSLKAECEKANVAIERIRDRIGK